MNDDVMAMRSFSSNATAFVVCVIYHFNFQLLSDVVIMIWTGDLVLYGSRERDIIVRIIKSKSETSTKKTSIGVIRKNVWKGGGGFQCVEGGLSSSL